MKLDIQLIDVETTFLQGILDESIFMDCPDGKDCKSDEYVLLLKALYGLVQSARQFFKRLSEILKDIGCIQSNVEPCLFYFKDEYGIAFVAIHVDDCTLIGNSRTIDNLIMQFEAKGLKLKVDPTFKDYLGYEVT